MRYIFLPPYSPDFNPIELSFASMKAWFRRNRDLVDTCWSDEHLTRILLIRMAFSATPDKAKGWFRMCGY
ncbi:hypothetical protein CPB86DRAFT_720218 [Serendipita vermifera]|nr:hypothetical protein CPB86DRAFT_720218 [Serendipita vermifera]